MNRPQMTARAPLADRISQQEEKLRKLDEQLGRMMTRRVDEQEKLSRMYEQRNRLGDGGQS